MLLHQPKRESDRLGGVLRPDDQLGREVLLGCSPISPSARTPSKSFWSRRNSGNSCTGRCARSAKNKPIFTLDFWNDGEFSHGCIAGGKSYLHINANGDYEPCAFIHYSDSNIRDKTLIEALQSPLFKAYQHGQPWNENHLRPCPLLDNPEKLVQAVEASGAKSTDLQYPEDVRDLTGKCASAAAKWARTAQRLWACSHNCETCRAGR